MLSDLDLIALQWQCGFVYIDRRQMKVSKADMKVILEMRSYFRADRRPPRGLIIKCLKIVSVYQARLKGLIRDPKPNAAREWRLKAARARMEESRQRQVEDKRRARIDAEWIELFGSSHAAQILKRRDRHPDGSSARSPTDQASG